MLRPLATGLALLVALQPVGVTRARAGLRGGVRVPACALHVRIGWGWARRWAGSTVISIINRAVTARYSKGGAGWARCAEWREAVRGGGAVPR